jgi:threonine/homoserine/homoserine lactone efflux protein
MIIIAFGFILGFVGYLPPGNINLTVVQLAINKTVNRLWAFILLASVMEFLYCLGCLTGLDLLMRQPHLVSVMQWLGVVVFAMLGLLSFFHNEDASKTPTVSGFSRGILAITINPFQIPFWLVWGVYLNDKLKGSFLTTVLFAFITAAGTSCVLWLYAIGGRKLVETLKLERKLLDRIVGSILILLAVLQLFKLLHKHG